MKAPRVVPAVLLAFGLVAGACGGGDDEATPAAGTPATELPPPVTTAQAPQEAAPGETAGGAPTQEPAAEPGSAPQATAAPPQEDNRLMRELFAYYGTGRDPFLPLTAMDQVRPLFEDLRVTNIVFDATYARNSVAVMRDTSAVCNNNPTMRCRYTVRVGDQVGQVRILEIRESEVIVVREQFGVESQRVLRLRGRQEGTP